jgi:hypothetical protein
LPDHYWDATANALKVDPAALVKDLKERDELKAFKAAEDVKSLSRPQTADAYKIELPKDFKMPAGSKEYTFDMADPLLAAARTEAHAQGLSQEGFSKILGIYAASRAGEDARITAAAAAEVTKLGTNGPARVDAVMRVLDGAGLGVLKSTIVTAAQVEAWEAHISKMTSQGAAVFSSAHRVPPDDGGKIAGFDKMSFEQKRQAQDNLAARRRV